MNSAVSTHEHMNHSTFTIHGSLGYKVSESIVENARYTIIDTNVFTRLHSVWSKYVFAIAFNQLNQVTWFLPYMT